MAGTSVRWSIFALCSLIDVRRSTKVRDRHVRRGESHASARQRSGMDLVQIYEI